MDFLGVPEDRAEKNCLLLMSYELTHVWNGSSTGQGCNILHMGFLPSLKSYQ